MDEATLTSHITQVNELWAEVLVTPGMKRKSAVFSAKEEESYRDWLYEEVEIVKKRDGDLVELSYLALLQSLQGVPREKIDDEQIREKVAQRLHDRVLSTFDPGSNGNDAKKKELQSRLPEVAKFLQFLSWLIRLGNARQLWQWCPPSVPMLLDREATPFTDRVVDGLPYVQEVRNRLLEDLRKTKTLESAVHEGRILVSAVVFGGMAEIAALRELHKAIRNRAPLTYFARKGWSFWDLEIPMGRGGVRRRRWFPDPLTETLLLRAEPYESGPEGVGTTQGLLQAMDAYLHRLPKWQGKFLRARLLMRQVPEVLRIELPQYLGVYAMGALVAHALRPDRWIGMHGYATETALSVANRMTESTVPSGSDDAGVTDGKLELPAEAVAELREATYTAPWLVALRSALRSKDRRDALRQVVELQGTAADALGELVVGWTAHLLRNGSVYRHRLTMTTIRRYVGRLAALMLQVLEEPAAVQGYADPAWRQLYEDLVDTVETEHQRALLLRAIREWHQFLVEKGLAQPLSEQQLGGLAVDVVPDARILSPEEFTQLKKAIDRGRHAEHHVHLPSILQLIVILGFRCGLRRMEALRLRMMDCHLEGRAMLLIRPFAERTLKSRNATRALPLHALLEPEELQLLEAWVAVRIQAGAKPNDFLFVLPEIGHNPISQETAMSRIHAEMRAVTGDSQVHFHHLRHSFACHLLWRLSLAQLPLAVTPSSLSTEREASLAFQTRLFGGMQVRRKILYALTCLLGHSQPEISLNHYVHNLDLLLAIYLRPFLPQRPVDWRGILPEIPQSTFYRLWDEGGIDQVMDRLRREYVGQGKLRILQFPNAAAVRSASATSKSGVRSGAPFVQGDLLEEVRRLLQQGLLAEKTSLGAAGQEIWERLSEEGSFRKEQLRAMAEKAKWIFELRGKGGLRHGATEIPGPGGRVQVPLPPKLRSQADLAVYQSLLPRVWESVTENSSFVGEVLDRYLRQAWASHPGYFLGKSPEHPESVADFRKLLLQWGIRPSQIVYVSYDPSERSVWRQQWREALNLHKKIKIVTRQSPDPKRAKPWLHVYPQFSGKGNARTLASPGFTYLLILGAIVLVARPAGIA